MAIFLIVILVVLFVGFIWFYRTHKTIKCNTCLMVTGAPKTGKSLLSVYLCNQFIFLARLKWCVGSILSKLLNKGEFKKDFPEYYANIPIDNIWGYIPITKEMLLRQEKIKEGSVVYLGEFSLVANSRLGQKNTTKYSKVDYDEINEQLLLFTKLCGHQWNGKLVVDSQTISDVHYSVKRVLSNYLYIHHSINLLFHKVLFVREMIYSDDNNSINTTSEDVEEKLKWLLIPKRKYYKMYDYRCYSVFTDGLTSDKEPIKPKTKKADDIVSFVEYDNLWGGKNVKKKV